MILEYLPINKDKIKYRPEVFEMDIKGTLYKFRFSYNTYDNMFYGSMYRAIDNKPIIEGKKIVYSSDFLGNIKDDAKPDNIIIIPVDFSNEPVNEINFDNFMEDVFLYIIDGGSND